MKNVKNDLKETQIFPEPNCLCPSSSRRTEDVLRWTFVSKFRDVTRRGGTPGQDAAPQWLTRYLISGVTFRRKENCGQVVAALKCGGA
ncbi:hypothetical protein E2C01_043505 [Portunus trituberculatus]|uniref:Uncharacterized protein n=1 Tax=Portunus trituberculatus TaxID=210409 RepID=A0A5B7FXI0_PORTR|nr:hypothetical protein [Portunus trituberculatus]